MKKKYNELVSNVLDYADNNGFLDRKNLLPQADRITVDVNKLHTAVFKKSENFKEFIVGRDRIVKTEDEINKYLGKTFYDLIVLAELGGVNLEDCLENYFKTKK